MNTSATTTEPRRVSGTVEGLVLPCRFDRDDAQSAGEDWGFNCGPGALCAILGMTPSEIRPHMGDFERKHYTNPTLMREILARLNVSYSDVDDWPTFGLVRVQWGGPWTKEGVPIRARYRHTHWVASAQAIGQQRYVYDVNAMCVGGWITYNEWAFQLVPWLLKECEPKADGAWWLTHRFEVTRQNTRMDS